MRHVQAPRQMAKLAISSRSSKKGILLCMMRDGWGCWMGMLTVFRLGVGRCSAAATSEAQWAGRSSWHPSTDASGGGTDGRQALKLHQCAGRASDALCRNALTFTRHISLSSSAVCLPSHSYAAPAAPGGRKLAARPLFLRCIQKWHLRMCQGPYCCGGLPAFQGQGARGSYTSFTFTL